VDFEFNEVEAVHILSDPRPGDAINAWVNSHCASETMSGNYNAEKLKKALGDHLAIQRIEAGRQLPLSTGQGGES